VIRFTAEVAGIEVLDRAFNRIDEYISDFRSVWPNVAREFYGIEHEQFQSEGAHGASGKRAPLSPAYKRWKEIHFPGEPILRLYHPLEESLTSPDGLDSVYQLLADEMILGSRAPYARAHQFGTGNMPARPPIDLTEEDKRRIQKSIQAGLVQFTRSLGFEVQDLAA
jgi:phage gpG-like protein